MKFVTTLSFLTLLLPSTSLAGGGHRHKYASYSKLRCPLDSKSTLPTPTCGTKGAVFTVCTEQILQAPIQKVYNALIDFQKYHVWNTFVVDVGLPPNVTQTPRDTYVNMPMVFTIQGLFPGQNTISGERVTFLSPPSALKKNGVVWAVWRNDDPAGTINTEHPNILNDAGNGFTRLLSYETYYKGAELAAPIRGVLNRQFVKEGVDLSDFVEGRVG